MLDIYNNNIYYAVMVNEVVKTLYNELFNPKEALSEDEFLDKLIQIESITKYNIFHNLLLYTDKNNIKELIKLYGEQSVKKKSLTRNTLERQSLNKLIGEKITIGEILDKYIEYIKKVFAEDAPLNKKLSHLKITYDYIDGVIFPPEGDTRIQPGSGKGLNTKEGYDRISFLFNEILNIDNNIYPGDFRVVIGKNDNNSLRKYSYVVIEIPKLNKTIFVNNKYGEATYIYNGIPTDKELLTKGKESLGYNSTRISFRDSEQRKQQVLDALSKEEVLNKQKTSYKNIKAKDLKDILDLEEKKEYVRNELNKKEVKEIRFSLTYAQRKDFKLNDGITYTNISKIFGITGEREYLLNNFRFVELSKRIFGETDPDVINLTKKYIFHTLDSIRNLFEDNEQLKQQRFFLINAHKRIRFKLKDGTTYIDVARFLGFKENYRDLVKDEMFIEISKKIFGENDPDIMKYINTNTEHTTNSIRDIFLNDEQLKQQRFSLDIVGRINFKLDDGTTYTKIARIFGITEELKDLAKMKVFIELNKRIFGEDDTNVIKLIYNNSAIFHTMDSIKEIFSNNESLRKQWFSLNYIQRAAFKLDDGTSYTKIARIFGFEENCCIVHNDNIFIELSKKIFGEDDPAVINLINNKINTNPNIVHLIKNHRHTINFIIDEFKNNKQLKERWFGMDYNKRKIFKLDDGTSYTNIARIFGFEEEREELLKDEIFIKLSKKIFGENDPSVVNFINKNCIVHTPDTIKNIFANNEQLKKQWFSLKVLERTSFKLNDGTTYIKIVRIFGIEENSSIIHKNNIFIELSKKIFGEYDPDVINFINTHVEHTVESIRSLFSNDEQLKKQWFSLVPIQRAKFKLKDGTSYIVIARIFGFTERGNFLIKDDIFIELNKKIFGESDPYVINLIDPINHIKNIFANNEQLKKQWFSLKSEQRGKFKLSDGTSYMNIARTFGIKGEKSCVLKNESFIELNKRIFGEEDSDVINLINNSIKHTPDSIRDIFLRNELLKKQRFCSTVKKRERFNLGDGTGYVSIARIYGFNGDRKDLPKYKTFLELSKKIFGEDDPDVIELSKKLSKK